MPKVSLNTLSPLEKKIYQLKSNVVYAAAEGNYKKFKSATKEHAKFAVDHFDLNKKVPGPEVKVPLFSKVGFRMAKVWFLNLFRKKSPEEKKFQQLAKNFKLEQDAKRYING